MLTKNTIKYIHSLELKKNRENFQEFVLEGEKIISEALRDFSMYIKSVYYTSDFQTEMPEDVDKHLISEDELKKISFLKTPNKVLAIMKFWKPKAQTNTLILALDGIQDPGNLGTIIRTADWFGIQKIVCSKSTVDFRNPKVLQATMGSVFRVSIDYVELETYLEKSNKKIYGALLEGESIYKSELDTSKSILILGNEGKGISPEIQDFIQFPISIPRIGGAESLNVSTANAIMLSEFLRNSMI
jgi:TrmH family RNA methyltransferase